MTVGVEAHTHEFIATAHEDQKFGFSLAGGDALTAAVPGDPAQPALRAASGCTRHIGSQIFDTAGFEVAAHRVVGLLGAGRATSTASSCPSSTSAAASASPTPRRRPARRPADLADELRAIVARECARAGLAVPAARGRARPGDRRAGHRHALRGRHRQGRAARRRRRPPLRLRRRRDERQHPHRALRRRLHLRAGQPRAPTPPPVLCRVVGKHCESGDIVVRDVLAARRRRARRPARGRRAPAPTAASMASNYNHAAAAAGGRGARRRGHA